MVQAWGVLPALALVYLIAAPGRLHRRIGHVVLAGAVTVAVSMWWIVMVLLTPASARPYLDGSQDNSPLAMVFEYNLLSRYGVGSDTTVGFAGPDAHGAWAFMIGDSVAPQVGWLYPLALIGLIVGVWCRGRAPRTDLVRAGFLMWALWFVVHAVAFSTGPGMPAPGRVIGPAAGATGARAANAGEPQGGGHEHLHGRQRRHVGRLRSVRLRTVALLDSDLPAPF